MASALCTAVLTAMIGWRAPATLEDAFRYIGIAADIASVADDGATRPLFAGADARLRTAMLLAATAAGESGFRRDIDEGTVRGDNGESVCIMQIRVARRRTAEGWSADDLLDDRRKCVASALTHLRASLTMCRSREHGDKLGGYTHGTCVEGNSIGRQRWSMAFAATDRAASQQRR